MDCTDTCFCVVSHILITLLRHLFQLGSEATHSTLLLFCACFTCIARNPNFMFYEGHWCNSTIHVISTQLLFGYHQMTETSTYYPTWIFNYHLKSRSMSGISICTFVQYLLFSATHTVPGYKDIVSECQKIGIHLETFTSVSYLRH